MKQSKDCCHDLKFMDQKFSPKIFFIASLFFFSFFQKDYNCHSHLSHHHAHYRRCRHLQQSVIRNNNNDNKMSSDESFEPKSDKPNAKDSLNEEQRSFFYIEGHLL